VHVSFFEFEIYTVSYLWAFYVELVRKCKYTDCQHNEKGCAVIKAVEEGEIDRGVYENYLKLRKEAWHYNAKPLYATSDSFHKHPGLSHLLQLL
jgi:putative ribosome biogenesis GTPase RsgA